MKKKILATGKRKTAAARATIEPGSGQVFINSIPLEAFGNELTRLLLKEPLLLAEALVSKVDIRVIVHGSGIMAKAEAARIAIARGLVAWSGSNDLKKKFLEYDRNMLVYDPRRKETKKPLGRGARRKKQTSKR